MNAKSENESSLAIVGMSCRFPGARTPAEYWQNVAAGTCSIHELSREELLSVGVSSDTVDDPAYVRMVSRVERRDMFDAAFFGISPNEAVHMDPQRRLLLMCAQEAMEQAGYAGPDKGGIVGVYVGSSMSTYPFSGMLSMLNQLADKNASIGDSLDLPTLLANGKDFISTSLSYRLNLTGPSINVNTACSTSLVAVHQACRALLSYDCDIAMAGGTSVFPYSNGYLYQEGGILSRDGRVYAFDARADGTVFGDGVGLVLLKRLEDALADGDTIHAIIKGSAINNDGSEKMNFAAPSVTGQMDVIAEALISSGVRAESITYVETHGTGTALGDPIEIDALSQVYATYSRQKQYCAITSVKPNIGHLDAAAGIAGLIKTVEALKHRQLPPSINFETPNPQIDFANSPFYVNTSLREWKSEGPRRAGVSSFGIGGTNAHVVVEEAPASAPGHTHRAVQLLLLSAKTPTALEAASQRLAEHLRGEGAQQSLSDIAYTLQVGRTRHGYRRMLVCESVSDALAQLDGQGSQAPVDATEKTAQGSSLVFMFTGQGSQYVNMGRGVYETEPEFRRHFDSCAEMLLDALGLDLRQLVFAPAGTETEAATRLNQTGVAQPALFALEYSLAMLLQSYGLRADAMIGHSLGEYVAACVAGVFSVEDGLKLVAARARLMQALAPGKMLSVELGEAALLTHMAGNACSLAAVNSAHQCVASGPADEIDALKSRLEAEGVSCRELQTSHAFHSAMMEPMLDAYRTVLRQVSWQAPQLPFVSNLSGTYIRADEATDPEYWVRHLRQAVRFADGVETLLSAASPLQEKRILLEVGPGAVLSGLVHKHAASKEHMVVATVRREHDGSHSDARVLHRSVGQAWLAGAEIDWAGYHAHASCRRVPLPTYPFDLQRFWVDADAKDTLIKADANKRRELKDWFYLPSWKQSPPLAFVPDAQLKPSSCCLVFADDSEFTRSLIAELRSQAERLIVVRTGERYVYTSSNAEIDITQPAHYHNLLSDLNREGLQIDVIVHALSTDHAARREWAYDPQKLERSFYSALYLCQALGEHCAERAIRLSLLGSHLIKLSSDDVVHPDNAMLNGVCTAIPHELPRVHCKCIDVSDAAASGRREALTQIAREVLSITRDPIVAYRGDRRWLQSFDEVPLKRPGNDVGTIRPGGVYLITGGLGGMGLALAEHLATIAQAKLVLVGRTGLPARSEWSDFLNGVGSEDAIARRISAIRKLESLGSQVMVMNADVADPAQMDAVVQRTLAEFGKLHGVIHAAGVAGGGIIGLKTKAFAGNVIRPKVEGTIVLQGATAHIDLDFFALCSSMTAISGGFGQFDYGAANAFQDAFAMHSDDSKSTRYIAINWDAWKEAGMAAETELPEYLRADRDRYLQTAILNVEGSDAFLRAISNPMPQWLVSIRSPRVHIAENHTDSESRPTLLGDRSLQSRPSLTTPYVAPRNELEIELANIWGELIGMDQVGVNDSFFELGGDSLLITRLLTTIRKQVPEGTQAVSLKSLFERSTVAEVAKMISDEREAQRYSDGIAELRASAIVTEEGEI